MRFAAAILNVVAWCLLLTGCEQGNQEAALPVPVAQALVDTQTAPVSDEIARQVGAFCGGCHVLPPATDFPREDWRKEVQQGFDLYFASARNDLPVPLFEDVLAYYESLAPDTLELPVSSEGIDTGGLHFHRTLGPTEELPPAIAHLKWIPQDDDSAMLLMCDMRSGAVSRVVPGRDTIKLQPLAQLENPAHIEPCDLNGDGQQDLVVSDLGSFRPGDHSDGSVVWLQQENESYRAVKLAESLGRVSDARAADFDSDGDQDLVLAVFGWRQTGEIRWLENQGLQEGTPVFNSKQLDPRHGSIHVPVIDFDGDGMLDFLAVFGQDYESVELFRSRGAAGFKKQVIYAADTPTFGSSGIRPTDLDSDGDIDILYTNGDMFDDDYLRTYHGVHWLENLGDSQWEHHDLARLPGVHRALEADLDSDGDLDVVACAFVPASVTSAPGVQLDSLIWLEQTDGEFERHVLEVQSCQHAVLEVGDFDSDGDVDLAVGNFQFEGGTRQPALVIWWNDTHQGPAD